MKLNKLIKKLKKVKEVHGGDIDVVVSGFVATNNSHAVFKIKSSIDPEGSMSCNGLNISIELQPECRKQIVEGIRRMESNGYVYYPSQYVKKGCIPKTGVSPCEWHIPW